MNKALSYLLIQFSQQLMKCVLLSLCFDVMKREKESQFQHKEADSSGQLTLFLKGKELNILHNMGHIVCHNYSTLAPSTRSTTIANAY